MSRYFFNFRQGDVYSVDEEGCDFVDLDQAYLGAFRAAQDLWRELLIARQDPRQCAFEITDSTGASLILLPFSEVLDACRGNNTSGHHTFRSFHHTLEQGHQNQRLVSEITTALQAARASLRETVDLLAKATKIAGD
jgi:hypothetical protein